ncbi:LytTR family transcriptional regulator DNA-binding domain-containing protein [Eggerthella lenta]|uniref:LytTR family transcriptional regulator DNA-binding domain-containing protein n=1 Tax=Eggerthella lenta TaxID=84112 RepID=UPI0018987E4F|nr:LytTR family transcriptional regulator DNA-binding domain-containing protein [Eggerthella lenta]MDB1792857.1 LytTR family transcriptional regulator DNA-binding domain-containing protein [Eggerthella lenta]
MSKANGSEALVAEQLSKDRAVIELCRRSLVNHFVVRDMDAALAYMADDVEWLGPFSCQTASDKKTMEDILRPEYSIRLALADERWRARKRANTWIVSARYTLLVVSAGGERSMPFKQHATYVWAPTPDGPRIVHLHVSNATDANPLLPSLDPGQNTIEFLYEHFDAQGSGAGKLSFRDTDGDVHVLHPNELYAIESDGPRCVIRHAHGKFAVRGALASLEKELPAKDFLRLHRSCLVHRGRIASIEDHQALLDDGSSYPIAERRSREIKQSFELTL